MEKTVRKDGFIEVAWFKNFKREGPMEYKPFQKGGLWTPLRSFRN